MNGTPDVDMRSGTPQLGTPYSASPVDARMRTELHTPGAGAGAGAGVGVGAGTGTGSDTVYSTPTALAPTEETEAGGEGEVLDFEKSLLEYTRQCLEEGQKDGDGARELLRKIGTITELTGTEMERAAAEAGEHDVLDGHSRPPDAPAHNDTDAHTIRAAMETEIQRCVTMLIDGAHMSRVEAQNKMTVTMTLHQMHPTQVVARIVEALHLAEGQFRSANTRTMTNIERNKCARSFRELQVKRLRKLVAEASGLVDLFSGDKGGNPSPLDTDFVARQKGDHSWKSLPDKKSKVAFMRARLKEVRAELIARGMDPRLAPKYITVDLPPTREERAVRVFKHFRSTVHGPAKGAVERMEENQKHVVDLYGGRITDAATVHCESIRSLKGSDPLVVEFMFNVLAPHGCWNRRHGSPSTGVGAGSRESAGAGECAGASTYSPTTDKWDDTTAPSVVTKSFESCSLDEMRERAEWMLRRSHPKRAPHPHQIGNKGVCKHCGVHLDYLPTMTSREVSMLFAWWADYQLSIRANGSIEVPIPTTTVSNIMFKVLQQNPSFDIQRRKTQRHVFAYVQQLHVKNAFTKIQCAEAERVAAKAALESDMHPLSEEEGTVS